MNINPYKLLGITIDSTLTELKKNYYHLSLICHPDKGGNSKDMDILHKSYKFVEIELKNISNKTYEESEQEFEDFCKKQSENTPNFYHIFRECHDWLDKFNDEFESNQNQNDYSIFQSGYGELLDKSAVIDDTYNSDIDGKTNTTFKSELVIYEEPNSNPDYINQYPLDKNEINDYSLYDKLSMNDYKSAFSNPIDLQSTNTKNLLGNINNLYEKEIEIRNQK